MDLAGGNGEAQTKIVEAQMNTNEEQTIATILSLEFNATSLPIFR